MLLVSIFLLSHQAISSEQCTPKSNIRSITDNTSLDQIKDDTFPTFLRLTSPGCPYSPASNAQWEKAIELFPQVNFVTVDCWNNSAICSQFGTSISTPIHGLVPAGSVKVKEETIFGNEQSIHSSPQLFVDTIQNYANIYPLAPPVYILAPIVSDSFYQNAENPIILLYDSRCSEQLPFLNAWIKASNEDLFPESDNSRIGLLDCSAYPTECKRWSQSTEITTPRAFIYSSKTGNYEILDSYSSITLDKINLLVSNADYHQPKATPTPVPIPPKTSNKPSEEGFTKIENDNLKNRDVDQIRTDYLAAFKAPSSACETPNECEKRTANELNKCIDINPSTEDHTNDLSILNFFRKLSGLPNDVAEDATWSASAYETAKNIHHIRRVPPNHIITPEHATEQYCGRNENIQVAQDSLLSENSASAFESMYKLFLDEGTHNNGVVGHRRYLLHPNLTKLGIGFYPYKEENIRDNLYIMKPAVTVHKIREGNSLSSREDSTTNTLKFVSWPPEGPFPVKHLPTNWHISHPSLKSVELKDLTIYVERDDGLELNVLSANLPKDNIDYSLVFQMSKEALERCTEMHKITVSVFNKKNNELYRFTFELFGTNAYKTVCLYDSDISKCTGSSDFVLNKETVLTNEIFKTSQNPVKINVVQPFTLTQPLVFEAPVRFFITGEAINGQIEIQTQTVVDLHNPSQCDIKLYWSVTNKKIGKLDSSLKAKNIHINVIDQKDKGVNLYDLEFYTGDQTQCSLSVPVFKGDDKYIYYTIGGSDYHYYVTASPFEAYDLFSNAENYGPDMNPRVKWINSIFDMKNQVTFKRAVKVFFNVISGQPVYIDSTCFIPGKKRDYQFINLGFHTYMQCDKKIKNYASTLTLSQHENKGFDLDVNSSNPLDNRKVCDLDNIIVKGVNVKQSELSSVVYLPYVLGDQSAIEYYNSNVFFDSYPIEAEKDSDVINTQAKKSKSRFILKTNGKHDSYTINFRFDPESYNAVTIEPAPGTESKQIKITFKDLDNPQNDCPQSETSFQVYFRNYKDLLLDLPVLDFKKRMMASAYRFENCEKVKFVRPIPSGYEIINLTTPLNYPNVDYGFISNFKDIKLPNSGPVYLFNAIVTDLNLLGKEDSTLIKTNITGSELHVGSSIVQMTDCHLADKINIKLTKENDAWPLLALTNTELNPNSIIIDLKQSARLLEDQYEKHLLITGILADKGMNCEQILAKTTFQDKGSFKAQCSDDKSEIFVFTGTPPSTGGDEGDKDDENTNDKPNDDNTSDKPNDDNTSDKPNDDNTNDKPSDDPIITPGVVTDEPILTKPPVEITEVEADKFNPSGNTITINTAIADMEDSEKQYHVKIPETINEISIDNQNNRKVGFIIPESSTSVSIDVKDESSKSFDIIPKSDNLELNLGKSTLASIQDASGIITINNKESESLNLNQVAPSSDSFTLIPKVPLNINEVDFNGKNLGLKVQADTSEDGSSINKVVNVDKVKVQKNSVATIESVTIQNIVFGSLSQLKILEKVDMSKSTIDLPFNDNVKKGQNKLAPLTGSLTSSPAKIVINLREDKYLEENSDNNNELLIAESNNNEFDCEAWAKAVRNGQSNTKFNDAKCIKSDGQPTRLLAFVNDNKGDKGNKLGPGPIAGIVIGVIVAVAIIVVVVVIVIKRKKNNMSNSSENEEANNGEKDDI